MNKVDIFFFCCCFLKSFAVEEKKNGQDLSKKQELDRRAGLFVCVEVLRPSQPNGVMSSAVSLPNHTFTGQA